MTNIDQIGGQEEAGSGAKTHGVKIGPRLRKPFAGKISNIQSHLRKNLLESSKRKNEAAAVEGGKGASNVVSLLAEVLRTIASDQDGRNSGWLSRENGSNANGVADPNLGRTVAVPSHIDKSLQPEHLPPFHPEPAASQGLPGAEHDSDPALASPVIPRAVTKPLTSEEIQAPPPETFWTRYREWFAEMELLYPIRVWSIVLLLVACFLTLFLFAGSVLLNLAFPKEEDMGAPVVPAHVVQDIPLASIETTIDAMEKITRGQLTEAREFLTKHDPPIPAARYLLAISDYFSDNVLQATTTLETPFAGSVNSSLSSEQALLAWVAMSGKSSGFLPASGPDDAKAWNHIQASLKADPTNTFAYMLLAIWQRRNNRPDEAVRTLDSIQVITGTSGAGVEVSILRAVACVGAATSPDELRKAAISPREGIAEIAAAAALQARWGDRNAAIKNLRILSSLTGMTSVTMLLADPIFQHLALTQEEFGRLTQPAPIEKIIFAEEVSGKDSKTPEASPSKSGNSPARSNSK